MKKRGFTLIELLVVIAIIGILAAMLFPVFARAWESARKIQCLSNVKNIAMGIQMYLTDYDAFPPTHTDANFRNAIVDAGACYDHYDSGGYVVSNWQRTDPYLKLPVILDEYIKNREVWKCPSRGFQNSAEFIFPEYTAPYWKYFVDQGGCSAVTAAGYLGSGAGAWPPGWGGSVTDSFVQQVTAVGDDKAFKYSILPNDTVATGKNTSELGDPSSYAVAIDGFGSWNNEWNQVFVMAYGYPWCPQNICSGGDCYNTNGGANDWIEGCNFTTSASGRTKYAPHFGGVNIGFADGHAKWWSGEEASDAAAVCACGRDATRLGVYGSGCGDWPFVIPAKSLFGFCPAPGGIYDGLSW